MPLWVGLGYWLDRAQDFQATDIETEGRHFSNCLFDGSYI